MEQIIFIISCIFLSLSMASSSTIVQCNNINWNWEHVGKIHTCEVDKKLNINSEQTAIINTSQNYNIKNDVLGFLAYDMKIEFFPRNLHQKFPKLIGIEVKRSGLKEIHQEHIKQFKKLILLSLPGNNIKILEEGLFDFNPDLVYVSFQNNEISRIHPTVFDNLNELRYLWLDGNECIDMSAENKPLKAMGIINEAKVRCLGLESENLMSSCCSQCETQITVTDQNGRKLAEIINGLEKFVDDFKSRNEGNGNVYYH